MGMVSIMIAYTLRLLGGLSWLGLPGLTTKGGGGHAVGFREGWVERNMENARDASERTGLLLGPIYRRDYSSLDGFGFC
jgi:hypothetical protein